ncbi:MAG: UPF0042 nucleotide-binding protein, partial [Flavobacteriales bacterium]
NEMQKDILIFVKKWIPRFESNNRSYLNIGIGCTGGRHRSVYLAQKVAHMLKLDHTSVQVKHRQLEVQGSS